MIIICLSKYLVKTWRKICKKKQTNKIRDILIRYHLTKLQSYHNIFMTNRQCYKYQAIKAAIYC